MSTYAGYQRYEVPNLGAVAASAIDKMTERDEKQELLDKQLKQKEEAAAAKDARKLAEETKKEEKKVEDANVKGVETKLGEAAKKIYEMKTPGASTLAGAAAMAKKTLFDYIGTYQEIAKNKPKDWSALNQKVGTFALGVNNTVKFNNDVAEGLPEIEKSGSRYIKDNVQEVTSAFSPTEDRRVDYDIDDQGNVKVKVYKKGKKPFEPTGEIPEPQKIGEKGLGAQIRDKYQSPIKITGEVKEYWDLDHEVETSNLASVTALMKSGGVDFDKQEQSVLTYGKQESALGGVSQSKNPKYKKERDAYANRIADGTDPKATYDGVYRYIPNSGKYDTVISVKENATPEEINEQIKATGYDKDSVFVMKYKLQNNLIVPVLDDNQKEEFKQAIKSSIDGKAEFKHTPERTEKKRTLTDQEMDLVKRASVGDLDAIYSIIRMGAQGKSVQFKNFPEFGNAPYQIKDKKLYFKLYSGKTMDGRDTYDNIEIPLDGSEQTQVLLKNTFSR